MEASTRYNVLHAPHHQSVLDFAVDENRFAPLTIENALDTEKNDVCLSFANRQWLENQNLVFVDDYYMNGYGIERLIQTILVIEGTNPFSDGIEYASEASACHVHFVDVDLAIRTAKLAAKMLNSPAILKKVIEVARETIKVTRERIW